MVLVCYIYLNCELVIDDDMKDEKDSFFEKKMEMWKKREEIMNSMSEKELRAFIKGYMMGQGMAFKVLKKMERGCSCHEHGSCECGKA